MKLKNGEKRAESVEMEEVRQETSAATNRRSTVQQSRKTENNEEETHFSSIWRIRIFNIKHVYKCPLNVSSSSSSSSSSSFFSLQGANASALEKEIGPEQFPVNEHYFGLVNVSVGQRDCDDILLFSTLLCLVSHLRLLFLLLFQFGNTCYCNSVLQALYFCRPFREKVLAYKVSDERRFETNGALCLFIFKGETLGRCFPLEWSEASHLHRWLNR